MNFDEAMTITKGNQQAALFLLDYFEYCRVLDTVFDEPEKMTDETFVRAQLNFLAHLCEPGWARDNAPRLYYGFVTASNAWLDSNRLAKSLDPRERLASEVLKNQCDEMERYVAFKCENFEHMRAMSANRQFDWDITPKEGV